MASTDNRKNHQPHELGNPVQIIEKPWEAWMNYGTTEEERLCCYATMREAMLWIKRDGKYYAHPDELDVIKRLPDGTMTTEY